MEGEGWNEYRSRKDGWKVKKAKKASEGRKVKEGRKEGGSQCQIERGKAHNGRST